MNKKHVLTGIICAVLFLCLSIAALCYHYGYFDNAIYKIKHLTNKTTETQIEKPKPVDIILNDIDLSFIKNNYSEYYKKSQNILKKQEKDYEKIINITNEYRYEENKPALEVNNELMVIAQTRAEELAKSDQMSHTRPDGSYFSTVFTEYGMHDIQVGENIAWGYKTPDEVCEQWKMSKSHYENILNNEWTQIGIGIAQYKDGTYVFVQEFSD